MTLKQLHQMTSDRKRLAEAFRSLLCTRNTIVDSFQNEYIRHLKLFYKVTFIKNEVEEGEEETTTMVATPKSEDSRKSLLDSLSRSRNMKKIHKSFLEIKKAIKENQEECKKCKISFQKARSAYEAGFVKVKQSKLELI